MDGYAAAVLAYAYIHTKGTGFAIHDVISGLSLSGRNTMCGFKRWIKTMKNILNRTILTHDSPPSGLSNGLRIPRSVLLLT